MRVAAVDLGASSGRVMVGELRDSELVLTEVHRFWNGPVRLGDRLHWDILALYQGILEGLRAAGPVDSIGIDSWGVDYGLLSSDGALLGNPVHYRDSRTAGVDSSYPVPAAELYARTGVQVLPFNTIYQLAVEPLLASASQLLMIPDLLAYWLTGSVGAEVTNASTTGLLDVRRREWDTSLMRRVGLDPSLFGSLREPGSRIGSLQSHIGLGPVPVVAVGSHDTASAVVGVPASSPRFAYISCGTWSLVGLSLSAPVLSSASSAANFSNELGVDGTVRYLRNVMGLWLLQECLRSWDLPLPPLLSAAATPFGSVVDAAEFFAPGDMPARIAAACSRTGQPVPSTPAETVRCILDSLALAHRRALRSAMELAGREVDVVHVVGGGARNSLLCQLTADACGVPVVAGPVEGAAVGNALVQLGVRGVRCGESVRYEPRGGGWEALEARLF
ncbi:rhamnulokinase [Allokutzneria sp. A3M-2-11 16]|uniref:rhamnulokinase n=1 Tax=Allokutzneria sp. A3M-2-11 16 TaxID=2962043 RepID=UPI0020B83D69|nr:rhamnulokinase family protein [Allokutzneria sp. A3M-2-11 16]MCP3804295.1 rhamnulokinase [Allokutzneria sp. A3M-2-11 16]